MMDQTVANISELIMSLQVIINEHGDLYVRSRNGVNDACSKPEVLVKTRWDGTKYVEIVGSEV